MSGPKTLRFTINGQLRDFTSDPNEKLLDLLRRNGFTGVKHGCGEATCGSCTVLLDGRPIYACILYAFQADGREVHTIESVGSFDKPHPLQTALVEAGAVQCGFCIPGIILSAKALLDAFPNPTEEQIQEHMDGNLCRCTGYEKIEDAIRKTAAGLGGGNP